MNQQTLKGQWNEIKGKVMEKWGELTDSDLQAARGNSDQLIGMIQQKTGETRESISQFVNSLTSEKGILGSAAETARDYASAAAGTVQETAQQAMDQVKAGYEQTETLVRRHPMESLGVCFGVGLVTGIVAGLMLRSN
jgi:uncharacterized protein YjbJ (UPF0337 family)